MYLPIFNLGCPDKSAELYKLKRMVKKLRETWTFLISIYSRYSYHERVLTKLLSTTGYRPRLNIAYLHVTSSHHGWSVCHKGKMVSLPFPPYKAAAPASPFCETSSKKGRIFFFFAKGNKTPSTKCQIFKIADTFSKNGLWMQYFTKKWAFCRKCWTIKDGAQTHEFIADKSSLLFSIF